MYTKKNNKTKNQKKTNQGTNYANEKAKFNVNETVILI